jgi:hypothetical protein
MADRTKAARIRRRGMWIPAFTRGTEQSTGGPVCAQETKWTRAVQACARKQSRHRLKVMVSRLGGTCTCKTE